MKKYFKVEARCGHVGKGKDIVIAFATIANSAKEASAKVRWFPRVKHHKKDAILTCIEIDSKEYQKLKDENLKDDYLKCRCIQEQNRIENFDLRIINIENEDVFHFNRSDRINRKKKISKILDSFYKKEVYKEIIEYLGKEYSYGL